MSNYDLNDPEFTKELLNLYEEIKKIEDEENPVLADLEDKLGFKISDFEEFLHEAMTKRPFYYKKLHEDAVEPAYVYSGDSGFDLHSVEEVHFLPFERKLVPTGLSFDIPEGFELQIRTKSGLALKQGLMVLNSPGTVDQGYTGEVKVILMNMNNTTITVDKGQKIAQAVLCSVESGAKVMLMKTEEIDEKDRGDKGFGSTGI
jgi:dUTP pyrophosphatase